MPLGYALGNAYFWAVIKQVSILGNGRVGTYLAQAFRQMAIEVRVFARQPKAGEKSWAAINTDADLCFICVADRAIATVSQEIPVQEGMLVHASGSIGLEQLDPKHPNRGIFYPLMSIKAESEFSIKEIPFCLEANSEANYQQLAHFAEHYKLQYYPVPSEKRRYLHLAAVFSHNFSNLLYHQSYQVLKAAGLPLTILKPLLQQQIAGLSEADPILNQTGPAVRKDENTLAAHLEMLDNPEIAELYQKITQLIQKEYGKKL